MSTRVEGGTVVVMITAHATLSAGPVRLSLSAREDQAPGTWRYNLGDSTDSRAAYGRVAGYAPGTTERGLLEQFAETGEHQHTDPREEA
jgi:hypothetical protein